MEKQASISADEPCLYGCAHCISVGVRQFGFRSSIDPDRMGIGFADGTYSHLLETEAADEKTSGYSSLAGFHNTGVRNFTLAHEIGHQLLHIYYPLLALSDQLEEDCADIIAEGLLLPECLVRASMAFFQFPDTLSHISRSQLDMNYPSFKKMARHLGVQRQLLANRMKYLHILTSDIPYRHTLSLMEAG